MSDVWSLENVLRLREEIRSRPPELEPERDEAYHPAAALLTSFVIDPAIHMGEAGANLAADCIPAATAGSHRWTLKNQVRKKILRRLYTVDALRRALYSTVDRPDDTLQRAIEAWLSDAAKPLEQQTQEELAATLQIVDWFTETELKSVLPPMHDVRVRVEHGALLSPLRGLVGTHFRGRTIELAALARYVDAKNVTNIRERPPVLIFGPGGMGKSTLVAKFVLSHLDSLPTVYLDCDRPGLIAEEPLTLLAEAVRQLGLQFPAYTSTAQQLRSRWLQELTRGASDTAEGGNRATTLGRTRMLQEFRLFVDDLHVADRKVLLVLDTFEEVQQRSRALVQEIFGFLEELQHLLPNLRTVLAGRNPVPEFRWEPLEIGELDHEAAEALLEALGVASQSVRRALARVLRGNPLSLRLAADLVKLDHTTGLDELGKVTDDTEIQGILYSRILGHIDEKVRPVAHPGLILRRVDPDILRRVLAEPCGLNLSSEADARELFDLFQNQLSLVIPEGDAVRHRPDVRRIMLQPLKKDKRDTVRRIEEAAVKYYEPNDDITSRAEEIYHRLSLGQPPAAIEPRWVPGVEDSLRSAVEELEGTARAYLASRLGMELYDQDWDTVDQTTWEAYAAKLVEDLLRLDRPLEALRVLRRRSAAARRPQSPLYWLHSQALRRSGQNLEAKEVARQGIAGLLEDPEWWRPDRKGPEAFSIPLQLMNWYAGPELEAPPSVTDVRVQIEWLELLHPLHLLASQSFSGRRKELAALASYMRGSRIGPLSRPPLLVFGPGGSGKSTLLARFALDRLGQIWLVFLNCASVNWSASSAVSPLDTLLAEAARQLGLQFPTFREATQSLVSREKPLKEAFRAFAEALPLAGRPLVIVLDDFEEVQYRSAELVSEIHSFVTQLRSRLDELRAIFVTRAPIHDLTFELLEMGRLDDEAAEAFLAAEGIESPELRQRIIRLVGGIPFSLRLAVDLIRQEGPAAVSSLEASADIVPAYLLGRILNNIHDEAIRRLARAALVVRRITIDVIQTVLAGPAGLVIDSDQHALELFRSLRDLVAIITSDGDTLRPRADVRRIILGPLQRDAPGPTNAIHEAAVRFYERRQDLHSRAEEIYHRLALGQSPDLIDSRWRSGIEDSLRPAIEELQGAARAYLAARLDVELDDIDWAAADQTTWEAHVAARALRLLGSGRYAEALELLRQRSTRLARSSLFGIEAQILLASGQPREALLVASEGLRRWPSDPALPPLIEQCEAVLGRVDADGASEPAFRSGEEFVSYHLDGDINLAEVTSALVSALPNPTDLTLVLESLGIAPDEVLADDSAHPVNVRAVVDWARKSLQLDQLVSSAATYAPDSEILRDFLKRHAAKIDLRGSDPLAAMLLPGMRLLFDRQTLREFLRGLGTGFSRYRVLAVDGPAGTGKSYTAVVLDAIARATNQLEVVVIRPQDARTTVDEVTREIHERLLWRWEEPVETTTTRRMRTYADMIRTKARRRSQTLILMFDIETPLRPDVGELIRELARNVGPLALVITGRDRQWLPPEALPHVMFEHLADLTHEDIVDGLRHIATDLNLTAQHVEPLISAMLERLVPGPNFNARVNQLTRTIVESWLKRSA